jgi:radical SAM protein with 4Fe4S-binding SPASM domain
LEVSKELSKKDLGYSKALKVIQQISRMGNPILVLSGGEPLLRPDIFELTSFARAHGLEVALASNGTLIDRAMALKIKNSGIRRVAVSLDGPDSGVHDTFRGEPGAFEGALRGCREIKKVGVSLQINTTLTKHNEDFLEQIYDLVLDLEADAFHLFMLVPVGCGLQIAQSHQVDAQKYEEILQWLYRKSLEKRIHVRATCAPHYFRIIRQEAIKEKRPFQHSREGFQAMTRGCLAGSAICFISHEGEVFPCGYLPISVGKVPETSLEEIWKQSAVFQDLREPGLLKGKCGVCEFKRVCMGCRARAFYQTGDYLDEEPFCVYEPVRRTCELESKN